MVVHLDELWPSDYFCEFIVNLLWIYCEFIANYIRNANRARHSVTLATREMALFQRSQTTTISLHAWNLIFAPISYTVLLLSISELWELIRHQIDVFSVRVCSRLIAWQVVDIADSLEPRKVLGTSLLCFFVWFFWLKLAQSQLSSTIYFLYAFGNGLRIPETLLAY